VILDQLENRYRRKFVDHWAFVRYAQKQKLALDITSPAQTAGLSAPSYPEVKFPQRRKRPCSHGHGTKGLK
jgi:hypothetical protein